MEKYNFLDQDDIIQNYTLTFEIRPFLLINQIYLVVGARDLNAILSLGGSGNLSKARQVRTTS